MMRESQHFYIYLRPSSEALDCVEFLIRNLDGEFRSCSDILKVKYENKIICYIYNSLQELQEKQHTKAGGFAAPEFETICYYYPTRNWWGFRHEIVHVLVHWTIGVNKLDFLNEGSAVAIEKYTRPAGENKWWVHAVASNVLNNDCLFSIKQLAKNDFFKLQQEKRDTTYHLYDQCGSLVRYLTDQHGMERFKSFYAKADQNDYRTIFRWIHGKEIEVFEEEWHEFLRNY